MFYCVCTQNTICATMFFGTGFLSNWSWILMHFQVNQSKNIQNWKTTCILNSISHMMSCMKLHFWKNDEKLLERERERENAHGCAFSEMIVYMCVCASRNPQEINSFSNNIIALSIQSSITTPHVQIRMTMMSVKLFLYFSVRKKNLTKNQWWFYHLPSRQIINFSQMTRTNWIFISSSHGEWKRITTYNQNNNNHFEKDLCILTSLWLSNMSQTRFKKKN